MECSQQMLLLASTSSCWLMLLLLLLAMCYVCDLPSSHSLALFKAMEVWLRLQNLLDLVFLI